MKPAQILTQLVTVEQIAACSDRAQGRIIGKWIQARRCPNADRANLIAGAALAILRHEAQQAELQESKK